MFRPHIYCEGTEIDWGSYVNCAVEPEMALPMGTDLHGTDLPDDRLVGAIESVSVEIELYNFPFWFDPPTSQELICSGGIHAGLIVSQACVGPEQLTFYNEMFSVRKIDNLIIEGPASEIMGGPTSFLAMVGRLSDSPRLRPPKR